MKKIELLAPAGNFKCLKAAIQAGCDAVYLGGKSFGARAFSKNFDNDEMIEAIKYAHLYGVKVYVTCNTLVYDDEVPTFLNYIEFLHKNNVDAILIQDLGMLDLVRKTFPNLEVHASTQMHIHNLDGVKLMESLGLKRVVLARETSIKDIKQIKTNSNAELEVFIHGALCVSYSGCCLMSYFNGGRSANRGECAGSCRLKYNVFNDDLYALSLKDLNTLDRIGELIDIGVSSLKIEGRMKSPSYVYLVVSLYRMAIDSYYEKGKVIIDKDKLHDLKVVFNREYTKGFLFNENNNDIVNMNNSNHQGIKIGKVIKSKNNNVFVKLDDDVQIGDALRLLSKTEDAIILNNFYINKKLVKHANKGDIINFSTHKNIDINSIVLKTASKSIDDNIDKIIESNFRKVPLTVTINAKVNEKLSITATDGKNSVKLESILLDKALNIPTSKEELDEKINRLNDTIYSINSLKINIDDNVFVPLKIFNDLRREVIDNLNKKRLYEIPFKKEEYTISVPDFKEERNTNILENNKVNNTIIRLPRVINNYDDYDINEHYLITEVGALNRLKNIDSDFSLNVVNSYTVAFLHSLGVKKITLSYELDYERIKILVNNYQKRYKTHPNLEVIISYYPEVMITKFDLNKYYNKDSVVLKNSNNTYITKSNNTYMSIYLNKLYEDNNNYFNIGINNVRINKEI